MHTPKSFQVKSDRPHPINAAPSLSSFPHEDNPAFATVEKGREVFFLGGGRGVDTAAAFEGGGGGIHGLWGERELSKR